MIFGKGILAFFFLAGALACLPVALPQGDLAGERVGQDFDGDARRVLSRMLRDPGQAPDELRVAVDALRESQEVVRRAWVGEYRPSRGASMAEVRSARKAFQEAYGERIRESRELRAGLLRAIRDASYVVPRDAAGDVESVAVYEEYRRSRKALESAWSVVLDELGEDVSAGELLAAKRLFRERNVDAIERYRELADSAYQLLQADLGGRGASAELPEELQLLRAELQSLRIQINERQRQAREEMRGMSGSERMEYRQELVEEMEALQGRIRERRSEAIDGFLDRRDDALDPVE